MKVNPRKFAKELPRRLQDCFADEAVADCLNSVDIVELGVPNAEVCTSLEETLLEEFACFKACETFECESDAQDVVDFSDNSFDQEQRCGGVDAVATCNNNVFTGNDVDSLIPNECLVDPDIEKCMITATDVALDNIFCDLAVNNKVEEFACLNDCEAFSCSALGEEFFQVQELTGQILGCGDIAFEASCEAGRVIGAGEGLRAGAAVVLAVGAIALKFIR